MIFLAIAVTLECTSSFTSDTSNELRKVLLLELSDTNRQPVGEAKSANIAQDLRLSG